MKIIFLDIDGVLIIDELLYESPKDDPPPFNKDCVKILNDILQETNSMIVLSSTWKKIWDLKRLDFIFKFNGIIKSPLDITSDFNNREKEITDYVQRNKVNDFLILDDAQLDIFPKNFIQCQMEYGLKGEGIKERAISILNLAPDYDKRAEIME